MRVIFKQHRFHSNVFEWFKAFKNEGHDIDLVVYRQDETEVEGLNKAIYLPPAARSVQLMKKKSRTRGDGVDQFSPYYFPSLKTLYTFLKSHKPQLVILRPVLTRFSYLFLLLKPLFGYKILFYSQIRICKPASIHKKLALNLMLKAFNAHWISPCPGEQNKYPPLARRMVYFPFTIAQKVAQRETYFKDGYINILVVAKMYSPKNILLVLSLVKELRVDFDNFRLSIYSGKQVQEEYYQQVLDYIEANQLGDIITIHIGTQFEKMPEVYLAHDIFILPSNYDQAAYVPVESMAYGLATFLSDGNGTFNYVTDGVDGHTFQKKNLAELKKKMAPLLSDKNEVVRLGQMAMETVKREHDPEDRVVRLLKSIGFFKG